MRPLDDSSGGWLSYRDGERELRYHPQRRQVDYLEGGNSVVNGSFDLLKGLSYTITTRREMYDDSVRDGTYEVTVYIYTAGIDLADKKLRFVREDTQYDRGITHYLHGRPFLTQLAKDSGLPLKESGLGVRNDSASGLIYMRHRWYDAQLGRFISRDPIGHAEDFQFQSFPQKVPNASITRIGFDGNLYRYVGNGPANDVDPEGLALSPCGAAYKLCIATAVANKSLSRIFFNEQLIKMAEDILKGKDPNSKENLDCLTDADEDSDLIDFKYRLDKAVCELAYVYSVSQTGAP